MAGKNVEPRSSWHNDPDHPDRDDWMELAIDSGRETIKVQREDLTGMRTRAVAFSALIVTAVAFLAGTGLSGTGHAHQPVRTLAFYIAATTGSLGFVAIAVLLVVTVAPFKNFKFVLEPDALMRWADGQSAAPSKRVAMNYLASEKLPEMIQYNWDQLAALRKAYRALLIVGVITTAVWILVVWIFT